MNINRDLIVPNLVIATTNTGKLEEFKHYLSPFLINILGQPKLLEIEETGSTFKENARLKAIAAAELTGEFVLADDSGLSVDFLEGAPGVYSARYAKTDLGRINRLLDELKPSQDRRAIFCAALCLVSPDQKIQIEVEGRCEGFITHCPRGKNGFGYDPIFEVKDTGLTFAEMESETKKTFGHRGLALELLKPKLNEIFLLK